MFKKDRQYHVVAINPVGHYTWTSTCGPFWPFHRVSQHLLDQWKEYASTESGHPCAILTWERLA